MAIRAIVTGVTGMVGEGVMHECLQSPLVEEVLLLGRRSSGFTNPKMKEIVHADLYRIDPIIESLQGYNACYFCLGTSSIGMKEADYFKVTHELTLHIAQSLARVNPDMVFCYVSGLGTDRTEKGRLMWARVKGKTENDLLALPFKKAYMFRPGFLLPTKGLRNTLSSYKYVEWTYPLMRRIAPSWVSTLAELGQTMIHVTQRLPNKEVLEVKDIVEMAK